MTTIKSSPLKEMIASLSKDLRVIDLANYEEFVRLDATFEENYKSVLENAQLARNARLLARRAAQSNLMPDQNLDTFVRSPETLPGVDPAELERVLSCSFVNGKMDVVLIGPSGRGKTHLANAVGIEALKRGYRVQFAVADRLLTSLREARDEKSLNRFTDSLIKPDLLIIDEVGYFSYNTEECNMLFRVVSARHNRASTIVTTNCQFSDWAKFITDPILLRALVDRLVDSSVLINMNAHQSYRLQRAQNRLTAASMANIDGSR